MTAPTKARGPGFRAVAETLRQRITENADGFSPGEPLPTDQRIADSIGVPRSTISRALAYLATWGFVLPRPKRGFVVPPIGQIKITRHVPDRYRKAHRERIGPNGPARGAFQADVEAAGLISKTTTTTRTDAAPAALREYLDSADPVTIRERVMFAAHPDRPTDWVPVQLADSYLPASIARAAGADRPDTGTGGLISLLASAGFHQARYTEIVNVRIPTEAEAEALQITADSPVYELLHIATTDQTEDSDPITLEVVRHVMPVSRWELRMSWAAE